MNYKEIKEILKNNDYKEVIKGILAFELDTENNDVLEHLYNNIYMGFDDNYLLNESFYNDLRERGARKWLK